MPALKESSEANIATDIVERIVDGDASAENQMVERYQRGLLAMLYNRSKDKVLSEDVAQDTWVLVLSKVRDRELRDASKLASFITQIARNQLIMRYRAASRQNQVPEDEVGELPDERVQTPEQSLLNSQLGHAIGSLLDEMSQSRDSELIKRFYLKGDNKADLCEEFDLTPAHFDRVLFRARARFKKNWSERSDS